MVLAAQDRLPHWNPRLPIDLGHCLVRAFESPNDTGLDGRANLLLHFETGERQLYFLAGSIIEPLFEKNPVQALQHAYRRDKPAGSLNPEDRGCKLLLLPPGKSRLRAAHTEP